MKPKAKIIFQKPYAYTLYLFEENFYLTIEVGSLAAYSHNILLTKEEALNLKEQGENLIEHWCLTKPQMIMDSKRHLEKFPFSETESS